MKNKILHTLLIALFCLPKLLTAQCDLPQPFTGNTGSNMTVMLTEPFLNSLNASDRAAYLVALDPNGLIVGSEPVGSVTQTSIAVWADDTSTPEVDGAAANAAISFQLVDGESLYDVQMPSSISFVANSFVAQTSAGSVALDCAPAVSGCTDASAVNYNSEATEDDGSCYTYCSDEWRPRYTGNTGSNMTMMLTDAFVSSLGIQSEGVYLVAITPGGLTVGSTDVSTTQTSLAVWGDDTFTPALDGAAEGESITVNLIDGSDVYDLGYSFDFVAQSIVAVSEEVSATLICKTEEPFGCTNSDACNYDSQANTDDGTCAYAETYKDCSGACLLDADSDGVCDEEEVSGCDNLEACNYDDKATDNDGTCILPEGCESCADGAVVDSDADNDGVCDADEVVGCQDEAACNYNVNATDSAECIFSTDLDVCATCSGQTDGTGTTVDNDADDDGVCNADELQGCTDISRCNYNQDATDDDGSCLPELDGVCEVCSGDTDGSGTILDKDADDDGVCDADEIGGCQDDTACNYDKNATESGDCDYAIDLDACASCSGEQDGSGTIVDNDLDADGVCDADELVGCMDDTRCNYNELATDNEGCLPALDGVCETCSGETDGTGLTTDNDADDDGVCDADEVLGCDEANAFNYSSVATENDGSCYPVIEGCINDDTAFNYSASTGDLQTDVNTDDGSCHPVVLGCTDSFAKNYNDYDDDEESNPLTGDPFVDVNTDDGSCVAYILGCTNVNSCNYQPNAVHNISYCDFPPVYYFCDTLEFTELVYEYEISCVNDEDGDGVCDENEIEGCTSSAFACNYNTEATDEVACVFPDTHYDCLDNCKNDSDSDGVCDELELPGCTDNLACNYDVNATDNDGLCTYSEENYDCTGSCLSDQDGDGVCDAFEVVGCTFEWAENYVSEATDDDGSCSLKGCTNSNYVEYDANATEDDGSYCAQLIVYGCNLADACNFDGTANTPDGSCLFPDFDYVDCDGICLNGQDVNGQCIEIVVEGCMDEFACNYVDGANTDTNPTSCVYKTAYLDCSGLCYFDEDKDSVCDQQEIIGCIEEDACNYDPTSTQAGLCVYPVETYFDCNNRCLNDADDDGICDQFDVESCKDELALNYNPIASDANNDLCVYPSGCMTSDAANYDAAALIDDGSCILELVGCTDNNYLEYNTVANINDQDQCLTSVTQGCMDPSANNYNSQANINNYVCTYDVVVGCRDNTYIEYNPQATEDSNLTLCKNQIVFGCTNSSYLEYNASANIDNGTCQSVDYKGCLDEAYQEYDVSYTINDQSACITPHIYGCMNSFSVGSSYNPAATIDDGSCILIGCSDTTYAEYYTQGYVPNVDDATGVYNSTFCKTPAVLGCVNSYALNYNFEANVANEECLYEDGEYIDFEYDVTDANCSVLMPNYGSSDVLGANVSFSGEFTQPFPEGSTIGVFYYDFNGVLRCGGSSIWKATETNSVSAYIDDLFTSSKDGFNENEAFNWRLQTPEGLLYSINVIISENSLSGNQFATNGLVQIGHMYTQFMYQVEIKGCMDEAYIDFNPYANSSAPCYVLKDIGCMDDTAFNYNIKATEEDGSCYPIIYGCNNPSAFNYVQSIGNKFVDPNTESDCIPVIQGCLNDKLAYNYVPLTGDSQTDVNTDDGSCYAVVKGCTDLQALNFNDLDGDGYANPVVMDGDGINTNTDDGSCIQKIFGCMDDSMSNYNANANVDNGVCYPVITGCTEDDSALNYVPNFGNPYLDVNDTVACILPIYGCMDAIAYNYMDTATVHDNSCIDAVYGCTDNGTEPNEFGDINDIFTDASSSFNYDILANTDDGTCYPVVGGCMDITAFNFNNYGSNKYISYESSANVFTDINTSDNSCIPVIKGCLDENAYNYNDFDLDGISSPLNNPEVDVNTHQQSRCFYRPGCTNQTFAQYWNYSIIEGLDVTLYPDSMLSESSCIDTANFFCDDPNFVESFTWNEIMWLSYNYPADITLVPRQSECQTERIDYCRESNYVGYFLTDNIKDGTDLDAGANFGIPKAVESSAILEKDLNPGDAPLCGDVVSFYCSDSSLTLYYAGTDVAEGTMKDSVGGNMIDDSLCGEVVVDLYCNDSTRVGYYNTNNNSDYDFNLGHDLGNIIDATLCGDVLVKYCDDPAFVGYYLGDTVGVQNIGTIIDDLETCGDSAVFYCNDPSYLGYYTEASVQGNKATGSHVDNSLANCLEPIDPYCSNPSFFEYYTDTLMSSSYVGNIVNDDLCVTTIIPGCTDETMFNYDETANINRTSIELASDPCYPIVMGCMNEESFNYNNYFSSLNTNPLTGEKYEAIDESSKKYGPTNAQDLISSSDYYDGSGNGFNVNTTIPTDPSTIYSGGCIPIVYGCTDDTALNFNDWSPKATPENPQYGDGIADSWNYVDPWLNVNTDNESCIEIVQGCMSPDACNYEAAANADDASCIFVVEHYDCDDVCINDSDGDDVCDELEVLGCTDASSYNFNELATEDDGLCTSVVAGCTSSSAFNYNSEANIDDGSCESFAFGCTDASAYNYNELANVDDFTCQPFIYGCTFEAAFNYNPAANTYNNSCIAKVFGCINQVAVNFNELANTDDGSCIAPVYGCMNSFAPNYNALANADDGSCVAVVLGCMDEAALNFNPNANYQSEAICVEKIVGCMLSEAFNYDPLANVPSGSCIPKVNGCPDDLYLEYNPNANTDDGSCLISIVRGCMNPSADNYDSNANVPDGSCETVVQGCMDPSAVNYNPFANADNGTCLELIRGCRNENAFNYNPNANIADGSCIPVVNGCTDSLSFNYNPSANTDNGSCLAAVFGCMNASADNYDANATVADGSCESFVFGCTDTEALNYNSFANKDDGTCRSRVEGCINPLAYNFNIEATVNDGSCIPFIYGCTDASAINYNSEANSDNGLCVPNVAGCMNATANNYNPNATAPDGSCKMNVPGCMDESAINYNEIATEDNGTCVAKVEGCTNPGSTNFNASANVDDDSCIPVVRGCIDEDYLEYNPKANTTNGTCSTLIVLGCTENFPWICNYNSEANTNDGSCAFLGSPTCGDSESRQLRASRTTNSVCIESDANNYFRYLDQTDSEWPNSPLNPESGSYSADFAAQYEVDNSVCEFNYGCTDETKFNYDDEAVVNQVSAEDTSDPCQPFVVGCMDADYVEYSSTNNTSNQAQCITLAAYGCTDANAYNFDASANVNQVSFEDASDPCIATITGCNDSNYSEYNSEANTVTDSDNDGLDDNCLSLVIEGCTDADYIEYYDYNAVSFSIETPDALANTDDGSCENLIVYGCTDNTYFEYQSTANVDDSSCSTQIVVGCTDSNFLEYDSSANSGDVSTQCLNAIVYGCTDAQYTENWVYNSSDKSITLPNPAYNTDTDPTSCETLIVSGCTNEIATNYNASANVEDDSCTGTSGCTDQLADNYNANAVQDDESCEYEGCTDSQYIEYNAQANKDNDSCSTLAVYGCMDPTAFNYNESANVNQVSLSDDSDTCIPVSVGCTDNDFLEYWSNEYSDSLQYVISPPDVAPNTGDVSQYCLTEISSGCTDQTFLEFSFDVNTYLDGACATPRVVGCDDPTYVEYDAAVNSPNNSYCITPSNEGCTDPLYTEYNSDFTVDDGSCATLVVEGCTDENSTNYNADANTDDGSCIAIVSGCTDNGFEVNGAGVVNDLLNDGVAAFNYNALANTDDESCIPLTNGCTDSLYIEYWSWNSVDFSISLRDNVPNADDDSCTDLVLEDCTNPDYLEYNPDANVLDFAECKTGLVPGCIDSLFLEYHTQGFVASKDDGSCSTTAVFGCTDSDYLEYYGFVDVTIPVDVSEYNAAVNLGAINNVDDGSCSVLVSIGCYNEIAQNNNPNATVYDPDVCEGAVGCTFDTFVEYNPLAIIDNGSCFTPIVRGCDDDTMFNYNPEVNLSDDSCYPIVEGCMDDAFYNYNDYDFDNHPNELINEPGTDINTNKASDCIAFVYGCTDNGLSINATNLINDQGDDEAAAFNYNPAANSDDGSCYPVIFGCMNSQAYNYNDFDGDGDGDYFTGINGVDVNTEYDPSNCIIKIYGCLNDSLAYNFNDYDKDGEKNPITGDDSIDVNVDDDSCFSHVNGCTDSLAYNFNDFDKDGDSNPLTGVDGVDVNTEDGSCFAVVTGCLDTNAYNFNDYDKDGEANPLTTIDGTDVNTHDLSLCKHEGCTNNTAANYETYGLVLTSFGDLVPASIDNGSCVIPGCTLESFPNFNAEATDEDGSCDMNSSDVFGCTDTNYTQYDVKANKNNGSCRTAIVYGCISSNKFNFDANANTDDGSCVEFIYGCMDTTFVEYSSLFNSSFSAKCITPVVLGCTNMTSNNFDSSANTDDGSCEVEGCTDADYTEYTIEANLDDGSCLTPVVFGCADSTYLEYWDWDYSEYNSQLYILFAPMIENVNTDDGSCSTELIFGCFYDTYLEYNINTNVFDVQNCKTLAVNGCTVSSAANYDTLATVDDGSCILSGCTNPLAFNYNPGLTNDDGSCMPFVYGCTIENYANYNPAANVDDGTCSVQNTDIVGCLDDSYFEYDTNATVSGSDYCINFMVFGCMDETMFNYDATVNFDDGSCIPFVYGCANILYTEYSESANTDDGSCQTIVIPGCKDQSALNFNEINPNWLIENPIVGNLPNVNTNDGTCIPNIEGCTDSIYLEYNASATVDDGSCSTNAYSGCTDTLYIEYYAYTQNIDGIYVLEGALKEDVNVNDGSCATLAIRDCVYDDYIEYNPEANVSVPENCKTLHDFGCMDDSSPNFDANATKDDGSCYVLSSGCMDSLYLEFSADYNTSDTSACENLIVRGDSSCSNPNYAQYYSYALSPVGLFMLQEPLNDGANIDDGCIDLLINDCTYNHYLEFNAEANVYEFGSCKTLKVQGCMNDMALNYDSNANVDNGTCQASILGCMNPLYVEYNSLASVEDNSCNVLVLYGCTDSLAINYNAFANTDDNSCMPSILGCMQEEAFNYNELANIENQSCIDRLLGCTDNGFLVNGAGEINDADGDQNSAFNYNALANTDDGSCETVTFGCINETAFNYNSLANTSDDSCIEIIMGCADGTAFNYNSEANTDDGSCYAKIFGCLDSTASNYNDYDGDLSSNPLTGDVLVDVNTDNGVCLALVLGCTDAAAQNFNQIATNDDGSCAYTGCINESADNYDPRATLPGFCQFNGCTDASAMNFNPQANEDDGSCIAIVEGCNFLEYLEYDSLANVNDGSCLNLAKYGCMNEVALNYDPTANVNQVSFEDLSNPCVAYVFGCTDNGLSPNGLGEVNDINADGLAAFNYNATANSEDGTCRDAVFGCMNPSAMNYSALANTNDGSCMPYIWGCTDALSFNFNSIANSDDGSCYDVVEGCMNALAFNYNATANTNNGSCIPFIYGCSDASALNYNPRTNSDDGSCIDKVSGCLNPLASNYNASANTNDGSCIAIIYGCTDSNAVNYNANATRDNGNCITLVTGCTNPYASNYNALANQSDGSCTFGIEGCTNSEAINYDENATTDDGSCTAVIEGCIWSFADNYNPAANVDDGSCAFGRKRVGAEVCIDPIAENYFAYLDPTSSDYQSSLVDQFSVDNSTCEYINGCTNASAYNYASNATVDDGSCIDETNALIGCMDEDYLEYDANANVSNTNYCLTQKVAGCTDFNATNFNPLANVDDASCITDLIYGCTNADALNYNPNATADDGLCELEPIPGCTDPNYLEYNAAATEDNGTCDTEIVYGCMESLASNYNASANVSNESCVYNGCTNEQADNYDVNATQDDGSCIFNGCTNSNACNYNVAANTDDDSCQLPQIYYDCNSNCINDTDGDAVCDELEISGCMDENACNYDSNATDNSGCNLALEFYDCEGVCLDDIDSDGICDELEIEGCQDTQAVNYDAAATDVSQCDYDGCTNNLYLEFDAAATVDLNNSCQTLILSGCTNALANNFDAEANTDDGSCNILGCTNAKATNYNEVSNQDDGTCKIFGCTDASMFNFDTDANRNDGSCVPFVYGCTESTAYNFNASSNTEDDSCEAIVEGCTDLTAFNYASLANTDDGSCADVISGCIDSLALNYSSVANTDDGSCSYPVLGCTNTTATNFDATATQDDGSCIVPGCTNTTAENYNVQATVNDNSCIIYGCIIVDFPNYNAEATVDDGACNPSGTEVYGCQDSLYLEYNALATVDNGSCDSLIVLGCNDATAFNYDDNSNTNDGTCYAVISGCQDTLADNYQDPVGDVLADINTSDATACIYYGCMDDGFPNYNVKANADDGSCNLSSTDVFGCTNALYVEYQAEANKDNLTCSALKVYGCVDANAFNYDVNANVSDDSCIAVLEGCTDSNYTEYAEEVNTDDGTCATAVVEGCTNSLYLTYNPVANVDNNTCKDLIVLGCMNSSYTEYNTNANTSDLSCSTPKVYGCADSTYLEYWNYITTPNVDYYMLGDLKIQNVNTNDGSCETSITIGCTSPAYIEYNADADAYDGTCLTEVVMGCIDNSVCNYNANANRDDGSCLPALDGVCESCTGETDGTGTVVDNDLDNDGVCDADEVEGCSDATACNYDADPTTDTNNSLCVYSVNFDACAGCSGETDGTGTVVDNDSDNDGVCDADEVIGCTDNLACNYDARSTTDSDNTTCIYLSDYDSCSTCTGGTDGTGEVVDNDADDDGVCDADEVKGCTDITACNYDATPTTDSKQSLCEIIPSSDDCATCSGETDGTGTILSNDVDNDDVCDTDEVAGCTYEAADNYNAEATDDDGSCQVRGCTDISRCNYDALANIDEGCLPALDGVCESCSGETDGTGYVVDNDIDNDGVCDADEVIGCMDVTRCNFNVLATDDAGCLPVLDDVCETCSLDTLGNTFTNGTGVIVDNDLDNDGICNADEIEGCSFDWADNYQSDATDNDGSCIKLGCTLSWADNYESNATDNDDSCFRLGCADASAVNYDALATLADNEACYYVPLSVELKVNNAPCKSSNSTGSLEISITGGKEPIEINAFGLEIENGTASVLKTDTTYKIINIPQQTGYRVYVSDAIGAEGYSFEGSNYSPIFDITAPEDELELYLYYDDEQQEVTFTTNASSYNYVWFVNNAQRSDLNMETLSSVENGTYGIYVKDSFGCPKYETISVETVDVEELDPIALEIYPNPSDGLVHVHYNLPEKMVSAIQVISLTGEVVHSVQLEQNARIETALQLNDLSAGMYLLEIDIDQEKVYRRITIK